MAKCRSDYKDVRHLQKGFHRWEVNVLAVRLVCRYYRQRVTDSDDILPGEAMEDDFPDRGRICTIEDLYPQVVTDEDDAQSQAGVGTAPIQITPMAGEQTSL